MATSMTQTPEDTGAQSNLVLVPPTVHELAMNDVGAFFEPISRIDRRILAEDHLDLIKSSNRAHLLERYVGLRGKKVLEIGSGFGTNLAVWIKEFGIDGYGVEPASLGFEASFRASKLLFEENDLDSARIIDAQGERLPFSDGTFDIVYSANVLEHTTDPLQVLREAVRVLKRGGIIHMEIPNYLSYFEGHYLIPMPPIWSNRFLALWVRLFGRDPNFVWSLKLINPIWCKRAVETINATYPVRLLTLGQDVFLEKLAKPFHFETKALTSKVGSIVGGVQSINIGNWMGKLIVALQGYYPIYLTMQKL
jgi:SAM-dependent methyltransferase